jgi:ABC-type branched-subunit amino acid transport system substrate-binding protein
MKKLSVALIFLLACSFGFAQQKMEKMGKTEKVEKMQKSEHTMAGYLVDKACATKMEKAGAKKAMMKAKNHTKDCALQPACEASGYGLMSHGKFIKFDEKGDKLAAEYLNKTKKEKDLWVDVKGRMDGTMMKVESIKDVKAKVKKEVKKKEAKKG